MTTQENKSLSPREATPGAASELFSFYKGSVSAANRFYPGAGARLRFASKDIDTLELPGLPEGLLSGGDKVVAVYKGAAVFQGSVERRTRREGRGDDAVEDVVCCGPWSKMARLVYRQYWAGNNTYFQSSRIILNQYQTNTSDADNGKPQSLDGELSEIAARAAVACGYQVGSVSVSSQYLPFDEVRDITVADAIRRELRFFPKAVIRFDYSTTPPTLHIARPSTSADAAYLASVPKTARRREYVEHPITGVCLEIETVADGYRSITNQTAGTSSPGDPDCLYATIQLAGATGSTVTQTFNSKTEVIPSDLNSLGWWLSKHPRLRNVSSTQLAITDGARSDDSESVKYQRISAATAGEIEAAGLKCRVVEFTCKATITTAEDVEEDIFLSMNFLTTNAQTRKYTWVVESSSSSGETCPENLAAAILADRSGTLRSERVIMRLGDSFPQLGDACDGLCLQSFEVDCSTLLCDLSFGAPDYLSPENMAALLSGFRNKRRASTAYSRSSGKPSDDNTGKTELGSIPPLSSTEFAPGRKSKTTIKSSVSGSGGSLNFDSSALEPGEDISVKTLTIKGSGDEEDKTTKILASEDIEVTPGGVKSVNSAKGELALIGGKGIRVETEGRSIKITADPEKESEDEPPVEPSNPCSHPGDPSPSGGVDPSAEGGFDPSPSGGGVHGVAGGVAADGDAHPGDDDCNCDK